MDKNLPNAVLYERALRSPKSIHGRSALRELQRRVRENHSRIAGDYLTQIRQELEDEQDSAPTGFHFPVDDLTNAEFISDRAIDQVRHKIIEEARDSILVVSYILLDGTLCNALMAAAKRVREITVIVSSGRVKHSAACQEAIARLETVKIRCSYKESIHTKLLVGDARDILIGSANWKQVYRDAVLRFTSPKLGKKLHDTYSNF